MFREIVFLVPWAPMYLFEGGLEREVDSRTLGEFWCSDIPAEDSLAKASSSLSLFGNWCSFLCVLHFLIKERVFSFFASSLMQLLPTLELVSFVDDPCAFVFLTSLDNWHFNYVVTSEHLSWNISLGVGRWQEREGTQESKLVKEVGWNLPCYSCIAPNFLPPPPPVWKRMNGEWASLMLDFEQLTLLVQSSFSRQRTAWIQTPGQEMWPWTS